MASKESSAVDEGVGSVEDSVGVTGTERAFGTVRWSERRRKDGAEWLTRSAGACNQAQREAKNSHDGQCSSLTADCRLKQRAAPRTHEMRCKHPRFYRVQWSSGYDFCLTHRRSPVRSWVEPCFSFTSRSSSTRSTFSFSSASLRPTTFQPSPALSCVRSTSDSDTTFSSPASTARRSRTMRCLRSPALLWHTCAK